MNYFRALFVGLPFLAVFAHVGEIAARGDTPGALHLACNWASWAWLGLVFSRSADHWGRPALRRLREWRAERRELQARLTEAAEACRLDQLDPPESHYAHRG
jgi:hypothetical protein